MLKTDDILGAWYQTFLQHLPSEEKDEKLVIYVFSIARKVLLYKLEDKESKKYEVEEGKYQFDGRILTIHFPRRRGTTTYRVKELSPTIWQLVGERKTLTLFRTYYINSERTGSGEFLDLSARYNIPSSLLKEFNPSEVSTIYPKSKMGPLELFHSPIKTSFRGDTNILDLANGDWNKTPIHIGSLSVVGMSPYLPQILLYSRFQNLNEEFWEKVVELNVVPKFPVLQGGEGASAPYLQYSSDELYQIVYIK